MALISSSDLVFADAEGQLITSQERIDRLVEAGHLFEACAVQSMVAEGLLSLAMFTAVSNRSDLRETGLGKRMTDSAFGRLIALEAEHGVLQVPGLSASLEQYAAKRTTLVDRHLPELQTFDYRAFLELGTGLMADLSRVYHDNAMELLRKEGLPPDKMLGE